MDEPPTISHEFEVLPAGAMPSHLQILGVDFWDRLKPDLKWGSRTVECTSPSTGKKFQMPFEIGHEDANINHIRSCSLEEGVANEGIMLRLRHDIHLGPKEQIKVCMFAECTETRPDGVYSIHSMVPEGFVWEKGTVSVAMDEEDGPGVWHYMQIGCAHALLRWVQPRHMHTASPQHRESFVCRFLPPHQSTTQMR